MAIFFENLLNIYLETALWLLFGLSLAAVIKGWIPDALVKRLLSGTGKGAVIRAALIGAPLPLCSCGVLPTAVGLHRSGASKPATTSFLIATPETGIDSISVTYALMGPVMAIIRPCAAITSAIVSGLLVLFFDQNKEKDTALTEVATATATATATSAGCSSTLKQETKSTSCSSQRTEVSTSCCSTAPKEPQPEESTSCCASTKQVQAESNCCSKVPEQPQPKESSSCCASKKPPQSESDCCSNEQTDPQGLWAGLRFALVDILDDIKYWMAFGLVMAALIASLIEPGNLAEYGSGLSAMLLMLVVGLPLYICASASTPLAASLLVAGMSPGAVLVFLLVGPATNIASLGILIKELGKRAVILYLTGISVSALILGLLTDALLGDKAFELAQGLGLHNHDTGFPIYQWVAGGLLLVLTVKPLRSRLGF